MQNILISLVSFLIAVSLLTIIHEFGHFFAARKLGVKVLRFSIGFSKDTIGFGKDLFIWHDRHGTEYAITTVPLGGYVKMLDETEEPVADTEKHMAFNYKSIPARMAIICAGPIFNMLFAVLAYWLVFMLGVSFLVPVLGSVSKGTFADLAGLRRGQEILAIDGQKTNTWEDISVALIAHLGEKDAIKFTVKDIKTDKISQHIANLSGWSIDEKNSNILQTLGLDPYDPIPPIVDKILPGYPAEQTSLRSGDLITALDDQKIETQTELTRYIREKAGRLVIVKYKRDGGLHETRVTPVKKLIEGGEEVGFIGIGFQPGAYPSNLIRVEKLGIFDAFTKAIRKTSDYTILTIDFLYKMVVGKVSMQYIAGPVSIAQYAGQTIQVGIQDFLSFLALVSISLGVLNMLPIPVLDGGHFLFCVIESITGKPLSKKARVFGYRIGISFLASLMILAIYNDFVRLAG
jgi:regulator of sigma E protease